MRRMKCTCVKLIIMWFKANLILKLIKFRIKRQKVLNASVLRNQCLIHSKILKTVLLKILKNKNRLEKK